MTRRLGVLVIFVLVALLATVTVSAATDHRAHGECSAAHAFLLAKDGHALVYSRNFQVFGCAAGTGHAYHLGETPECGQLIHCIVPGPPELMPLAGTVVAYAEEYNGSGLLGENYSWFVVVRGLRTGRVVQRLPTGARIQHVRGVGTGPATAIAVKGDGAVAWITNSWETPGKAPPYYEVHAADRNGTRLLATGNDIDPESPWHSQAARSTGPRAASRSRRR